MTPLPPSFGGHDQQSYLSLDASSMAQAERRFLHGVDVGLDRCEPDRRRVRSFVVSGRDFARRSRRGIPTLRVGPGLAAGERPSARADFVAMLDAARAGASTEDLDRALDFAMRSAAIETGAIEGLYQTTRGITRTVALQGAMWEAALAEVRPEFRGHFEAQLDALEHVLDVVTASRPITEVWIRELHATVCRPQLTYGSRLPRDPKNIGCRTAFTKPRPITC